MSIFQGCGGFFVIWLSLFIPDAASDDTVPDPLVQMARWFYYFAALVSIAWAMLALTKLTGLPFGMSQGKLTELLGLIARGKVDVVSEKEHSDNEISQQRRPG